MDRDKKPKKAPDPVETIIVLVFILFVIGGISARVSYFLSGFHGYDYSTGIVGAFLASSFVSFIKLMGLGISAIAFIGIIWNLISTHKLTKEQDEFYHNPRIGHKEINEERKNPKWDRVLEHMNSTNPSDWKLAILEADIILDSLLDISGYRGSTMSDKLKNVEPGDFKTINAAWDAHKVRNIIAHEGSDFIITEREARRVIGLYKSIFEEFQFI